MKSDLIELELVEHHRTEEAILVSKTGERGKAVSLPLWAVELSDRRIGHHGWDTVTVMIPERLAIDKGLV